MATEQHNTRRTLLKALPVGLMAALTTGRVADAAEILLNDKTPLALINHHFNETIRLMRETSPDGTDMIGIIVLRQREGEDGYDIHAGASPVGKDSRPEARFTLESGWKPWGEAV